MCRVFARDVQRGVSLSQAICLGLLQDRCVVSAFGAHLAENKIARAVDDAEHRVDSIDNQPLVQCSDYRHAAGTAGFERDAHATAAGQGVKLRSVMGEQGLVRCNHMLASPAGPLDNLSRKTKPADQLDDDIDRIVSQHLVVIIAQQIFSQARLPSDGEIQIDHIFQLDIAA